jgi:hypothetical protein
MAAGAGFCVPALLGWLAVAGLRVQGVVYLRADISVEDNARPAKADARRYWGGSAFSLIVFLTVCLMLLSVPGIHHRRH